MNHIATFIRSRSTLLGFAAVVLLFSVLVIALLIRSDSWSRKTFDLVEKNNQQVQLVIAMRDALQERKLILQHMLTLKTIHERGLAAEKFRQQADAYARAYEALLQLSGDEAFLYQLRKLNNSAQSAQTAYDDLVEQLIFNSLETQQMQTLFKVGIEANDSIIVLLDDVIKSQLTSLQGHILRYQQSRNDVLFIIGFFFLTILLVVIISQRISGRQFKKVSRLTIEDEVSGTYNRRYFDMVLEEEWKRSMREYTPLSLLMLDIDFFKEYNDKFGHQMGDECLYTIGKVISDQLKRAADFTARYGGEEFAIVLPNTNVEHARLLAERLRRAVEEARIEAGRKDVSPWVTVSIGLATTTAEYGQTSATLVKAADNCLYDSKRHGRNRVSDKMLEDLV